MTRRALCRTVALGIVAASLVAADASFAADATIMLPLGRTVYQTNEAIPLAVVRNSPQPLPAGMLQLTATGADSSQTTVALSVAAVPVVGVDARSTEHLYLNGRLLRPGHYLIEAAVDGALATTEIDVYSHVRKTSFKLINWGRTRGDIQQAMGEDSLGYNLFYGHYAGNDAFIQAGVDYMQNCTMSGGHQMDLRMECDWSDPYVTRGGTARVVRQALADRTMPNVTGVHFYDEPGLTWHTHPVTGQTTPHMIPSQVRSYVGAFGEQPLDYSQVDPNNPDHVRRWRQWARWKLGFMDAAWKEAQFGVSYVRPDFLSVTQSQYGFSAFSDGYYFNVARSLPVVSGHGGYDDWGPGYFNPSYTLEVARARDFAKPCWYLPTWYGNTPPDRYRMEQYLSFHTNIQGMMSPPDLDPGSGRSAAIAGIVESNRLMGKLGTIFTTMPVLRPPVAMLYSPSNLIDAQTKDMGVNYAHGHRHGRTLAYVYLAGKLIQHQFLTVVDEDIVDGTLAANHKAIVLGSIDYLDPEIVSALEDFAARGNPVLMTNDCGVKIKGGINLGVTPSLPNADLIRELQKDIEANRDKIGALSGVGGQLRGAEPLAKAIKDQLAKAGIEPVFQCDHSGIVATRQAAGDVEYIFAVNAAYDYERDVRNGIMPVEATITLAAGNRRIYDAVRGGNVGEFRRAGANARGTFRFGPGQMRVFVLTAQPIGSVKAAKPKVIRDYTITDAPLQLQIGATVLDSNGGLLSGSIPLYIKVIDPLGAVRHDIYRATRQGTLQTALPLSINDPAGTWRVVVRELLNNTEDITTFTLGSVSVCGAVAGSGRRAACFEGDTDHIFRFARVNQDVTVVIGTADYHGAVAERIGQSLIPWGIRCKVVAAAEVNKPKQIPQGAAQTWTGLAFGRVNAEAPATGHVGFAIDGPVILIGTPEDNPLIKYVADQRFLPYKPVIDVFPGRGRGMVAWQRDAVGHGQESITLIAYDRQGMSEAVGTMYEAVAGLEPLTRWELPKKSSVTVATKAPGLLPEAKVLWQVVLPDKAVAMKAEGAQVSVLTKDGTLASISGGKLGVQRIIKHTEIDDAANEFPRADTAAMDAAKRHARPDRLLKVAANGGNGMTAIGFWGGLLRVAQGEALSFEQQLDQDIVGLAWVGNTLAVGLADGRVIGLAASK
jgi:hypothetical protein